MPKHRGHYDGTFPHLYYLTVTIYFLSNEIPYVLLETGKLDITRYNQNATIFNINPNTNFRYRKPQCFEWPVGGTVASLIN